jgi:hypothetical protein
VRDDSPQTSPAADAPKSLPARLQDLAEELIYKLNVKEHWIFKIYDFSNEVFASIRFRGLRRRAGKLDIAFETRTGVAARIRFLHPEDTVIFQELLASFDSRYLPPHPCDARAAAAVLRRRAYLPFGIFVKDDLIGYLLLRLFYPFRAVTGIWTRPRTHNLGIGQEALKHTGAFTRREGIPDYATIPVDNPNSVRMANAAGWQVIRTNKLFHVLLNQEGTERPSGKTG